ncbi:MAG: hypothetical protein OXG44_10200, partial [Gammaproteobacteria bacterium]|nr:hypothetical protein [Gammaproteobacteria bacterium]
MIPVKSASTTEVEPVRRHTLRERQSWQRELLEAVTDVDELLRLVDVDPSDIGTAEPSAGEREGPAPRMKEPSAG